MAGLSEEGLSASTEKLDQLLSKKFTVLLQELKELLIVLGANPFSTNTRVMKYIDLHSEIRNGYLP